MGGDIKIGSEPEHLRGENGLLLGGLTCCMTGRVSRAWPLTEGAKEAASSELVSRTLCPDRPSK